MSSWRCPDCENAQKPIRKDNTPISKQYQRSDDATMSVDDTTMSVDDYAQEDGSVIGDTFNPSSTQPEISNIANLNAESITLDKFGQLLDAKLEEKLQRHKNTIILEIRSAFQSEINKAVDNLKKELTLNTDALCTQQVVMKEDISYLDEKIEKLESENKKLHSEIHDLQKNADKYKMQTDEHDNKKIMVIYGLPEYQNENENDLEKRVINMFRDVMNVDLTGYVEEIIRIGKHGRRRPILLEIISKRMTKYILNNARQFKSTGVFVSEFLKGQALQDKRRDQEKRHQTRLSRSHTAANFREPMSQLNARESRAEMQKPVTQPSDIGSTRISSAQSKSPNETSQKIGGTFRF